MAVQNQSGFRMTYASIIRRRFASDAPVDELAQIEWDVLGAILEVNLYESIFEPVMTGTVMLVDSAAMSASINFQGQEIINLQWSVGEKFYNKNFYIYSVGSQSKDPNTQSSILVLNIIERHGYLDQFKFLNSTSAGDIGTIIADLLNRLDAGLRESGTSDQSIRIMHNNRKPLSIVRWVAKRATNSIGEPMFCYSTLDKLTSDTSPDEANIKFRDLTTMMGNHPWVLGEDFIYSLVPPGIDADRFMPEQYRILDMDIPENDNVFELANSGAMRSIYYNIDPFRRTVDFTRHDGLSHYQTRRGDAGTGPEGTIYDDQFDVEGGNPVASSDSIFYSGINTTSMFDGQYRGYNEETDYEKHRFKISREADIVLLGKERFSITVPGFLFGYSDAERGVGTTISIKVPKDQPAHTSNENTVDHKRSGKFLIMNKRHIMKRVTDEYHVVLEVGRPDTEDNVNDPNRWNTEREQRPR